MRLSDRSQNTPKPLARIGHRPIIWPLMSYSAYYGHADFILWLGSRGDAFKEYFLNHNEIVSTT